MSAVEHEAKLGVKYLSDAKTTDLFKEFVDVFTICEGKAISCLPVGYKENLKNVFFITNLRCNVTTLRKDAITALAGDPNGEIAPAGMKVTINGIEHRIRQSWDVGRDDLINYNVLGDDFIHPNCTEYSERWKGSQKSGKMQFDEEVLKKIKKQGTN